MGGGDAQRLRDPRRGRACAAPAPPRTALAARPTGGRRRSRVQPRPLGVPAAPGAAMAPALWSRLGRILWLACLLPLAPARVAAGKAPRGSAGRPPRSAARRGPRGGLEPAASPGAGAAEVAPCALCSPPSSPEAAHCGGDHGPTGLSLHPCPLKSPAPGGLPAPLASAGPPDRPCPKNGVVAGASIPEPGSLQAAGGGGGCCRGTGDAGVGRQATDPRECGQIASNVALLGEACHPAPVGFGVVVGGGGMRFSEPGKPACHFLSGNGFQNGPRAESAGYHSMSPGAVLLASPPPHRPKASTPLFWAILATK